MRKHPVVFIMIGEERRGFWRAEMADNLRHCDRCTTGEHVPGAGGVLGERRTEEVIWIILSPLGFNQRLHLLGYGAEGGACYDCQ